MSPTSAGLVLALTAGVAGATSCAPPRGEPTAIALASLGASRDRLLATYGAQVHSSDVCGTWAALSPSARDVFLTITHRLDGAALADGSRMLDHIVRVYRIAGSDGGEHCGGGERNRIIVSQDAALHAAQLAAFVGDDRAAVRDIPAGGYWRASHDLGGPHPPFDISDETDGGAPRGQTQYFRDPRSALANAPLGRAELETVIDPYALEIDQDYNCPHDSNPDCRYITYGPLCFPEPALLGTAIYTEHYGDFEPAWRPAGC